MPRQVNHNFCFKTIIMLVHTINVCATKLFKTHLAMSFCASMQKCHTDLKKKKYGFRSLMPCKETNLGHSNWAHSLAQLPAKCTHTHTFR